MWHSGRIIHSSVPAVISDHRSFRLWTCHLLRIPALCLFFQVLVTLFWPEASFPTRSPNGSAGPIEAFGKVLLCVFYDNAIPQPGNLHGLGPAHLYGFISHLFPLAHTQLFGVPPKSTLMSLHNWFPLPGMLFLHWLIACFLLMHLDLD